MKKRVGWLFLLITSLLLVGCQPKEDPKELALLGFDNVIKTSGFKSKSDVLVNVDLSKVPTLDDEEKWIAENFKGFSASTTTVIDKKKEKMEAVSDVKIPLGKKEVNFGFGIAADEANSEIYLDSGKLASSVLSVWSLLHEETALNSTLEEELNLETVDRFIQSLAETFKNSYVHLKEEDGVYMDGVTDDIYVMLSELRPVLEKIPADFFTYDKDKKDAYGHIVVKVTEKEVIQIAKAVAKEEFDKELKNITDEEEKKEMEKWYEENVNEYESYLKDLSINTLEMRLLVDDEKHLESWNLHIKLAPNATFYDENGEEVKAKVPLEVKLSSAFSQFNKPSFSLPEKKKTLFDLNELMAIYEDKVYEFEELFYYE